MDILHKLGLVPGDTRPGVELFLRLFDKISTTKGICGYGNVTSETWKGCADADSGNYEKVHAKGLKGLSVIVALRSEKEKAKVKKESVEAMYKAGKIFIMPAHLLCLNCFHGGREKIEPVQEDNLAEVIYMMQKNPDISVTLVDSPGGDTICPPCTYYDPVNKWCHMRNGAGLRNQKKNLDVLQVLGLKYGDTLPAKELLKHVYERIHSTRAICGYGDGKERAYEWSICGGSEAPEGAEGYKKGRKAGLGFLKVLD